MGGLVPAPLLIGHTSQEKPPNSIASAAVSMLIVPQLASPFHFVFQTPNPFCNSLLQTSPPAYLQSISHPACSKLNLSYRQVWTAFSVLHPNEWYLSSFTSQFQFPHHPHSGTKFYLFQIINASHLSLPLHVYKHWPSAGPKPLLTSSLVFLYGFLSCTHGHHSHLWTWRVSWCHTLQL